MSTLCELFGVSQQAYYKGRSADYGKDVTEEVVLAMVNDIRKRCPKMGTRKLQKMLEKYYGLNYGRDKLFELIGRHNLLVRQRSRKPRTTYSGHFFHVYPNLVKDMKPTRSNQVWVSDITYVKVEREFQYLFLVTDMYSRKIVGWTLSQNMEAKNAVAALRMAIGQKADLRLQTTHHSDKGSQYCCAEYVRILKSHEFLISMTEASNPRENAYAERVNGTIKNEFIKPLKATKANVNTLVSEAIDTCNTFRIHSSIS